MTKEEAKAYAQKLAQESGLSTEDAAVVLKAFDNDKFVQGLVPRPEYSRSLDQVKSEYEPFKRRVEYLENEWYPQAKAAHETNLKGMQLLDKYRKTFGELEEGDPAAVRRAAAATGLSKDDVKSLLKEETEGMFAARDRATLDLMDIREQHIETFKKRLDTKKFEQFVQDRRKDGDTSGLTSLYRDFVDPDMKSASEASLSERIKREREEAVRDFASRNKMPSDPKPREAHLLYDRESILKDAKKENGTSARSEFLDIMRDSDPDTIKQRYPTA